LIMPMVLLSAILGVTLAHGDNNIFTQIGLIVLVGLASKNAILIVEFARDRELVGADPVQATLDAARLRLRPILMTSLAFVAGVTPLAVSTGAGANSRVSIGTGIVGGTVTGTVIAVFFVPVFFVIVRKLVRGKRVPA
ncbi:MAG TPA: efflux RND transporter permease subunit, partial [Kofleriaceae bacterium]|nr:efflux RND transporter permease subunit [Kofleriaceae bacterium]